MASGSRAAGNATTAIARPAIRKLLKGRKLEFRAKGVPPHRPPFVKQHSNNFGDLPAPKKVNGKWQIHIKNHDKWNAKDYREKADALKSKKDLKYVEGTSNHRKGSAQKKKRQLDEEQAVREAADMEDAGDLPGAQKHLDDRLNELDSQEADHIIDLQVGGKDELANLKMIDATTNHGMGGQLLRQLEDAKKLGMKDGDPIEIVELPGLLSNKP
jgi:hypothetical protein